MKISPTRRPGRYSGRMSWTGSMLSPSIRIRSFRNPSGTRCCFAGPMSSNAFISPFPNVSCPTPGSSAGGISRRAPTPVCGGISARSWPTCWGVTSRSRRRWTGLPRRQPNGPSIRRRKSRCGFGRSRCRCRGRVGWVDESWDDIVGAMAADPTPGIECRMRKSWRKV